jgi:hypothetical protein
MDCLPLEDVCNLQVAYERRMKEEVRDPFVYFDGVKDTYLFLIDGNYVIVIKEKENDITQTQSY